MRTRIVVLAMILAAGATACRKEVPPAPEAGAPAPVTEKIIRTDARNAKIDVTLPLIPNAVANCTPSKSEYAVGEPIQLTINLNEAPEGLNVGARLIGDGDEQLAYVLAPGAGRKAVTLTVDEKPKAGTYKLEGYWGGNLVCEHEIRIGGAPESSPAP